MKRSAITLVAALVLLAGCAGTSFNWDQARQIRPGMTESELEQLMGRPYLVRSGPEGHTWVWSYASALTSDVKSVSVVLREGRVVSAPDVPKSFK